MLDGINSPDDLKKLSYKELETLSSELRDYIITVVSENGGHLASNLGVVELTLALHRVFSTPRDKIVWDVGHQSYIHKIITGRREKFSSIRKMGGISGFPKREESEHDAFETGHSSTSISAALGMAKARDLAHENYSVIAVIGDGALTGGMSFEALNHAGDFPTNLIVILNDNEMSISQNIGGLSNYLSRLRTEPAYFKLKNQIETVLNKIPLVGKTMFRMAEGLRDWFKYLVVPGVIFEELGFKYLGPIDGHDIRKLEDVLRRAKAYNGYPVLIHVVTVKGKGYSVSEDRPQMYHSISPFFIENGELKKKSTKKTYSELFGDTLMELAVQNERIVAVSAAMAEGTGLGEFAAKYKDRFFDVGIAEQHAVTFCAGLAAGGFRPVFAVYSTFLQRAYDQILHDVCMQNLPVVFAIDRAGIVGSDGETHQGVFDITYLRHIPNITIMSPKDGRELKDMLRLALSLDGPAAIRYPRGNAKEFEYPYIPLKLGKAETIFEGKDGVIISEGNMVFRALEVYEKLRQAGRSFTVINARFLKPLDEKLLLELTRKFEIIYTIEDNMISGGFGSSVLELLSREKADTDVKIIGYEDSFIPHGEKEELYTLKKLDSDSIFNIIMKE
ncbi:MAG TPA: 1-deoxy-D-xylulose-5-phosphate synthase [Clostridia bacterium]|nr:1-deoxy-D-xylulose-5-phosphate synthase [Clostridia bacterium]